LIKLAELADQAINQLASSLLELDTTQKTLSGRALAEKTSAKGLVSVDGRGSTFSILWGGGREV